MKIPRCPEMQNRLSPAVKPVVSTPSILRDVGVAFRDASEGAEMRIHLVCRWPLGHAKMSRLEFILMAAGPSIALVAVFIRLTGIG